jgi:DNA-binding CsgD family transcriptional regulator
MISSPRSEARARLSAADVDLLGRDEERRVLTSLLDGAATETGTALVVVGEAGVGKSALLRQAAREAGGTAVLWLKENAIRPVPGQLAPLGAGLAVLRLLVTASQGRPLLCIVDDADLLAPAAQAALAVAARRVSASPVVLLLAARTQTPPLDDLPRLAVADLSVPAANRLLDRLTSGALDPWVLDRLVAVTGGNPQGLADLATRYTTAELGRIAVSPAPARLGEGLLAHFGASAVDLPADTRSLLLALAAAADQDVTPAGPALGFTADSWRPALRARLLADWPLPRFAHPLTRSAVYFGAPPGERRRVHAVLASLPGSPSTQAWHRAACALPGPDEALACELAKTAETVSSASERCLLQMLSGELSADSDARADRYAAGARAALIVGAASYAQALTEQAEAHLRCNAAAHARAAAVCEQARGELGQPPRRPAAAWLLEAARAELTASPDASQESTLCALSQMVLVRDGTCGITPAELAGVMAAVNACVGPSGELGTLLLYGFGRLIAGDYATAVEPLRQALSKAAGPTVLDPEVPSWFPLVAVASLVLWDDTAGTDWLNRVITRARATGALLEEKRALGVLRHLEAPRGQLADADFNLFAVPSPLVAAWRGDRDAVRTAGELAASGELSPTAASSHGLARIAPVVAALGERRFPAALRSAHDIRARDALNLEQEVLPYLVEAAAACGRLDQAHDALGILRGRAAIAGTDWARGQLHCAEGILADGEQADAAFVTAIEALRRTRRSAELARAHLLYGEALTSRGRTGEAGTQLRTAVGMFCDLGAVAYASRARRALRAAGERPAARKPAAGEKLTDQELRIARLAAAGATNHDIGQQLFIGASTVDYHLSKVYRKLGVSSRRALGEAVTGQVSASVHGLCASADSPRPPRS